MNGCWAAFGNLTDPDCTTAVSSEPTARLTSILPGFSLLKTLIFAVATRSS
jgi:hypothetical protein